MLDAIVNQLRQVLESSERHRNMMLWSLRDVLGCVSRISYRWRRPGQVEAEQQATVEINLTVMTESDVVHLAVQAAMYT